MIGNRTEVPSGYRLPSDSSHTACVAVRVFGHIGTRVGLLFGQFPDLVLQIPSGSGCRVIRVADGATPVPPGPPATPAAIAFQSRAVQPKHQAANPLTRRRPEGSQRVRCRMAILFSTSSPNVERGQVERFYGTTDPVDQRWLSTAGP